MSNKQLQRLKQRVALTHHTNTIPPIILSPSSPLISSSIHDILQHVTHDDDEVDEEEDEEELTSSDSDSSVSSTYSSSSYSSLSSSSSDSSSSDISLLHIYRVFLCPIPVSCDKVHPTNLHTDLPPPDIIPTDDIPLSPCHTLLLDHLRDELTIRLSSFGEIIDIDIRCKLGVYVTPNAQPPTRVGIGVQACPDCAHCSACQIHRFRHFAYCNIRTTKEKMVNQHIIKIHIYG